MQVRTEDRSTPGTYIPLTDVQEIAAGDEHSLARKEPAARTVWGWGANSDGQLGNNSATAMFDTAVQVVTEDTAKRGPRRHEMTGRSRHCRRRGRLE